MQGFGLVGWQGSGCAELLLQLIAYYRDHDLRIAAVKLAAAEDAEGVISQQRQHLLATGCAEALVVKRDKYSFGNNPLVGKTSLALLLQAAPKLLQADLVLYEGLKELDQPKLISVHPRREHQLENTQLLAAACPNVVGLAAANPMPELRQLHLPVLDVADTASIAAFICRVCNISIKAKVVSLHPER